MIDLTMPATCSIVESQVISGWNPIYDNTPAEEGDPVLIGYEPEYTTVKTVAVEWPANQMSISKVGS